MKTARWIKGKCRHKVKLEWMGKNRKKLRK